MTQPFPPQPDPSTQQKANLFKAGTVAVWVWVVLSLIPVVLVLACCGFCGLGGVIGAATGDPTPTP